MIECLEDPEVRPATDFIESSMKTGVASGRLSVTKLDDQFRDPQSPAYRQWLEWFQSDSAATIQQHPDFAFHDPRALKELRERPGYFLSASFPDGSRWAAGIVPKTVKLPRVAGLGLTRQVRGYRLIGSRFFGHGSAQGQETLLHELEEFLDRQNIDFLLFEDVLDPSPVWNLLNARTEPIFRVEFLTGMDSRSRIHLPTNADDYWKSFSKNARKQNRRTLDDSRQFRLWCATEVDQVADLLAAASQVSERSWQADRLQVRLCRDEAKFDLLTFQAQQRALRSYVLYDGETPIAFELDHQFNGYLVSDDAAYDQRYAEHSPGRALLLRVLEDLFERDTPEWYDFAAGDWDYKRRYANDQARSAKLWLVRRNLRFGIISTLLRTDRSLRSGARRVRDFVKSKVRTTKTPRAES